MMYRYTYNGGVWVDLEHPTEDEVRSVAQEFSISERLTVELFAPTPTPLVASDNDATFLVLPFSSRGTSDGDIQDQEIDFIIGAKFIITVRYEAVEALIRLHKLLEVEQLVASGEPVTTAVLIEIIFAHLFTSVRDHITLTAARLAHIEQDMFHGLERTTVRAISNSSREFLHLEASLANQEEPLTRFLKALIARDIFGVSFTERAERILAERSQILRLVKTYRAVSVELRETNTSLLEARQNEIMKTLTIVNFIFLPLGLISWTFSMRTEGMPIIDSPHAFWIVLALMFGVTLILTLFFIRRRWL